MTQLTTVEFRLKTTGEISRNWCIKNFITRLSAIMLKLKKQGYVYTTKTEKDKQGRKDFIYVLSRLPRQIQRQADNSENISIRPEKTQEKQRRLQLQWTTKKEWIKSQQTQYLIH